MRSRLEAQPEATSAPTAPSLLLDRDLSWIAIGRRLKCDACDEKAAKLRLVPARRNIQRLPRTVH
jgi:hypothetical protein